MKKEQLYLLIIFIIICLNFASAYTPPANSPMARGEHPRLFFNSSDLPAMRDRIATYYATEFQSFITMLNGVPGSLSSGQQTIENNWGSLNFAFIAALDPQIMATKGFTFSASLDTSQEFCDKAVIYARTQLSSISSASSQSHTDFSNGYPIPVYFPVIATYDWCYPYLSSADKTAIVDAFVSDYNTKYKGNNPLNMVIETQDMVLNNRFSPNVNDILGILGFYNDSYPSKAIQNEMYDFFHQIWINRTFVEFERFYGEGTGWHEDPDGYMSNGFMAIGLTMPMMSSALGHNYMASTPFFNRYPVFLAMNVKPQTLLSQCGSGAQRCPEYLERWGTNADGIAGIYCRNLLLDSGILRKEKSQYSGLAKWVWQNMESTQCSGTNAETSIEVYGGAWANAVMFKFIYGDKDVTAQSPAQLNLEKTQKLGLGEYVMKSGWNANDSQVVFWAPYNRLYGHATPESSSFTLNKYGNLILEPSNTKSAEGRIDSNKFNLFDNNIGIHSGASAPTLGWSGGITSDPFWSARGIANSVTLAGKVLAEDINNGNYDYISYDNNASWGSAADISQREFAYLRGPSNKEYVVVFDRINVADSSNEKIWKIWVPAQPVFENGNPTSVTGGWYSTNTDTMSMTDAFTGLTNFAPTHGKFYMKTLAPNNFKINVLGGDGKEFQGGDASINYDGSTPWGAPAMTQDLREYLGWGRIDVIPTAAQNYDNFLNVIQFGDSNTLSAMSPTIRVNSGDGKMIGTHIQDSGNQWVVMFAKNPEKITATSYTLTGTGSVKHFIANLVPNSNYNINDNGSPSSGVTNSAGVLYFISSLGSTHTFTISQGALATCSEMGGILMSSPGCAGKICSGSLTTASDGACCIGTCIVPAATCSDGIKNQDESDVDCGGVCTDCANGKICNVNGDCASGNCSLGICKAMGGGSAPAAPSNLIVTIIGNLAHLVWQDNSNNEDNFIIYRSEDNFTWNQIASMPAGTTTYDDVFPDGFVPLTGGAISEGVWGFFSSFFERITGFFVQVSKIFLIDNSYSEEFIYAEKLHPIERAQGSVNKNLVSPVNSIPYKNRSTGVAGTVDSVAVWIAPNLIDSLLFVTHKDGDTVSVWNFTTWNRLKDITGIDYPNGVAVDQSEGTLYVTVRNSNIIAKYFISDILSQASPIPAATFPTGSQPYGVSVYHNSGKSYIYVTTPGESPDLVTAFTSSGAINISWGMADAEESIAADDDNKRIYIADEVNQLVGVYSPSGAFIQNFGQGNFTAGSSPEGIAIYECDNDGYIIASDQYGYEFEIYDRNPPYNNLGRFKVSGAIGTDGIAITQTATPNYPLGAFFAQAGDSSFVSADWGAIANATGMTICMNGVLGGGCTPSCAGKCAGESDGCSGTCGNPCNPLIQTCSAGVCTTHYKCSGASCVANITGSYTTSNCNNMCSGGAVCNNGIIETGEVCDGTNLNGQTCVGLGFTGGNLACASNCLIYNTSGCTSGGGGNNIYVDNNAPAGGDGSIGSPYKTINEGLNTAQAGYTVIIRGDSSGSGRIYNGGDNSGAAPNFIRAGIAGNPITLKNYPGEKVIVQTASTINFDMDYTVVDGLIFDHLNAASRFLIWTGNYLTLKNSEVKNGVHHGIEIRGSDNSLILNNLIHDFKIYPQADYHCIVTDMAYNGAIVGLDIINNTIYNCSGDGIQTYYTSGAGTTCASASHDILIEGNTFFTRLGNGSENAIDMKEGCDITIKNNLMYGFSSATNGVVVLQKMHDNVLFEGNIIYDSRGGFNSHTDSASDPQIQNVTYLRNVLYNITQYHAFNLQDIDYAKVYHNTVDSSQTTSIHLERDNMPDIKNNLIYNSGSVTISSCTGITSSNNGWFNAGCGGLCNSTTDTTANPLFVNAASHDYHLQAISPAIDKGANIGFSYSGSAPDLGAYEYAGGSVGTCASQGGTICVGEEICDIAYIPASDSSTCCPVGGSCNTPVGTCSDGVQNQDETDIDCGGDCVFEGKTCANGKNCIGNIDCTSDYCNATSHICQNAPGGGSARYYYKVCANNSYGYSCSNVATWSSTSPTCTFTNAYWSTDLTVQGSLVTLTITGNNCSGQKVNFSVWEDDGIFGKDAVNLPPNPAVFIGNTATTTWVAEWQCDGEILGICTAGVPEYYFIGKLDNNSSTTIQSSLPELVVNELSPTCGNNITQGGEQCDDGNTINTDACTNACLNAICGDGFVRSGVETCDGGSQSCTTGGQPGTQTCNSGCNGWNTCIATVSCNDGICSAGENCQSDAINCTDNTCYEPTCLNGCGQTPVANGGNDEACLLPNYCNGAGSCAAPGTFSLNVGRIVGASGNGDGKIALLAGTVKNVVFNFSANGSVGNLNDSSAKALFSKSGINRMNSSCKLIYSAANKKTYGCTIGIWFYDEAGNWSIIVNISDNSGNVYGNNTEKVNVETLREIVLSSAIIGFPGINPGNTNVLAINMPLNITNKGNYEGNVSVLGHNLHGITNKSEYINVNNFRAGIDSNVCNSGSSLVNGTAVSVSGSWLSRGVSANEELYYCLKNVPAVSTQTYSTMIGYGWRIGFF